MEKILIFVVCVLAICCQIVLSQRTANGYVYNNPNGANLGPHESNSVPQQLAQDLRPPPHQQHQQLQQNIENGALSLPFAQNSDNFALQQGFNQPASNFQLPNAPQLHNINYSPSGQQFNQQSAENLMRLQFETLDGNQGNGIEQGCGPEPIVGQFKPELVDLANGGPLTRMITTCGPNGDCKSIALQSDLNRAQGVLSQQQSNRNQNSPPQIGPHETYLVHIESRGRGNVGTAVGAAGPVPALVRPRNRRLIQYSEILQDDPYN
ncbi:uncharacterized protein LOC129915024 [Episyrphus balteatus]|uniref:uncharacterized protein LOC129915024 n=1 Tax=Episyrphus balteatus TaxID=286459 RepID=UPI0024868356|nr:uncharacterized protein LOC129915024 [Episyrphus balteatus]